MIRLCSNWDNNVIPINRSFKINDTNKNGSNIQSKPANSLQKYSSINLKAHFVPFLGSYEYRNINDGGITYDHIYDLQEVKKKLNDLTNSLKSGDFKGVHVPPLYLIEGNRGNGKSMLVKAITNSLKSNNVPVIDFSSDDFEENANLSGLLDKAKLSSLNSSLPNGKKAAIISFNKIDLVKHTDLRNFIKDIEKANEEDPNRKIILLGLTTNRANINTDDLEKFQILSVMHPLVPSQRKEALEFLAIKHDLKFGLDSDKNNETRNTILDGLSKATMDVYSMQRLEKILIESKRLAAIDETPNAPYGRAYILNKDVLEAFLNDLSGLNYNDNKPEWAFRNGSTHEFGHVVTRHAMKKRAKRAIKNGEENEGSLPKDLYAIDLNPRKSAEKGIDVAASVVLKSPGYINGSFEQLFAETVSNYGGLSSENLIRKVHANGVNNDIENATLTIDNMVRKYAMGKKTGALNPSQTFLTGMLQTDIEADDKFLSEKAMTASNTIVNFYQDVINSLTDEAVTNRRNGTLEIMDGDEVMKKIDNWVYDENHPERQAKFNKLLNYLDRTIKDSKPEFKMFDLDKDQEKTF